jgi:hypothetical protein
MLLLVLLRSLLLDLSLMVSKLTKPKLKELLDLRFAVETDLYLFPKIKLLFISLFLISLLNLRSLISSKSFYFCSLKLLVCFRMALWSLKVFEKTSSLLKSKSSLFKICLKFFAFLQNSLFLVSF